jgi:hypothetical protein
MSFHKFRIWHLNPKISQDKVTQKRAMKKQRFEIIIYNKGDDSFYETKVKTWFGWVSFTVFYKTEILHILSVPSVEKSLAYERIYHYCHIKGYDKNKIEIIEINNDESKNGYFPKKNILNK